jgi:hypothetical protein
MRTRSPVTAALTCTVLGIVARHRPLTRVAFLEDIFAHWSLHLIGIEKLLESGSSRSQTNEALRDGRSQMGTRKKGQSAIFPSALLQGDPEPKRSRRRSVLWVGSMSVAFDQNGNELLGVTHKERTVIQRKIKKKKKPINDQSCTYWKHTHESLCSGTSNERPHEHILVGSDQL